MECKAISSPILDLDEPQGIVVAYANVYNNEDSDKDISMPGSFTKTVSENFKNIRVFKDHNPRESLGIPKAADTVDPYGLKTTTQFNMKKDLSKDMYSDIVLAKSNNQDADLSIGYGDVKRDTKDARKINEYGWLGEWSFLSSWGANPLATVQDVKAFKNLTDEQKVQAAYKYLIAMYNLPHSDTRLIQVENILKSLTTEPSDTLDTLETKPISVFAGLKTNNKSVFTFNI